MDAKKAFRTIWPSVVRGCVLLVGGVILLAAALSVKAGDPVVKNPSALAAPAELDSTRVEVVAGESLSVEERLAIAEAQLAALRAEMGTSVGAEREPVGPEESDDSLVPMQDASRVPRGGGTSTGSVEPEMSPDFGALSPQSAPPTARFNMPAPPLTLPVTNTFGNGFELKTKDDEYTLQFHDLTQFDGRFYSPGDQATTRDTFTFPRQWFIFNGRLTKPIEYYVSIAEGFDTMNILDVFINFHYSDKLQFKVGRYKTPFTYEFYALPINGLINPERSLFFNNFGLNRDLGVMAWGALADKRVDYAFGVFNGTRNGFVDANDAKDIAGYLNFRPFAKGNCPVLEFFNFGGSMNYGDQNNTPIPTTFRTIVPTVGNPVVGIPFLTLNNNVLERGERQFFSLHSSYFYQHLSVVGEWQSGFQSYNFTGGPGTSMQLPVQSGYAQAGFFVTGETVSGRGMVKPIRPFDVRKGKFGWGAWEPFVRYNYLRMGEQIFDLNYANRALYTNQLYTFDLGFNWYLTQYLKIVFEWEHAEFDDPVIFRPGQREINADLFLTRLQLFF